MCFSPQRRAIFRHRNFKKRSEPAVFCAFSLENVLLATAACNFSTSELQKVLRTPQFFSILTWKCASRHSGVQFLISPLTTWLRTRRFNEPTFRLTRHTNHWKNTAFRDFSNIWRGWIFFLLTFALLHLLSSDSTSSSDFTFFWLYFIYLLFICFSTLHIVGSLLFKLPSIISLHQNNGWWMCETMWNLSTFKLPAFTHISWEVPWLWLKAHGWARLQDARHESVNRRSKCDRTKMNQAYDKAVFSLDFAFKTWALRLFFCPSRCMCIESCIR